MTSADEDRRHPGLQVPDSIALAVFGAAAAAVTAVAMVESYTNLLAFALAHGLHGWRAAIAPGCVDSFILMGELLLFSAMVRRWSPVIWYGAVMAVTGLAVSVGGNVWHASVATPVDRMVAAVFPLTATAAMAGGLMLLKRTLARHDVRAVVPRSAAAPVVLASPPELPRQVQPEAAGRRTADRERTRQLAADNPGMAKKDIAERLGVHPKTVSRHLAAVNGHGSAS
jgi:hypothetical protein